MEECKLKVSFLQEVVKLYIDKCPKLASYFGSKLALTLKKIGAHSLLLCPHCGTHLTTYNSETRTLTLHQLRMLRRKLQMKGHSVYSFIKKRSRSNVVVCCKVCGCANVVDGLKARKLPYSQCDTPLTTPSLPNSNTPTPKLRSLRKKSGCSLKSALHRSQKFKHRRSQLGMSPKLSIFLTSL